MAVTAPAGPQSIRRVPLVGPPRRDSVAGPFVVVLLAVLGVIAALVPGDRQAGGVAVGALLVRDAALVVVPGVALGLVCRLRDRRARAALVVPLSLAVVSIVAGAAAATHHWDVTAISVWVLLLSGWVPLGAGIRGVRSRMRARDDARRSVPRARSRTARVTAVLAPIGVLLLWGLTLVRPLAAVLGTGTGGAPTATLLPASMSAVLERLGGTVGDLDALHRWPGLVATTALFTTANGAATTATAAALLLAAAALVLVDAVLVTAIARGLGARGPLAWLAGLAWTGTAGLLAESTLPRTLALTLLLAAVAVAVRTLRRTGPTPRTSPRPAVLVAVLATGIAVTDPLSAMVLAVAIVPFLLSGAMRPRWLGVALVAAPVVALLPDVREIGGHLGLLVGVGPESDPGLGTTGIASTGSGWLTVAVVVALLVVTALALVRLLRNGHRSTAAILAWFAVAPVLAALMFGAGTVTALAAMPFALPFLVLGVPLALAPVGRRAFVAQPGLGRTRRLLRRTTAATVVVTAVVAAGVALTASAPARTDGSTLAVAAWLDRRLGPDDTAVVTSPMPVLVGSHADGALVRPDQVVVLPPTDHTTPALYRTIARTSAGGSTWVVFRDGTDTALRDSVAAVSARRYAADGYAVFELVYRPS
jgi:hypothetical protein